MSVCGSFGLTIIAFIGSVFSPYYALARRSGSVKGRGKLAVPENHVAVNVALYGPGVRRWTMTERSSRALARTEDTLEIGPSTLHWDGEALNMSLDEISVPVPRRVRGKVRIIPQCMPAKSYWLDSQRTQVWQPIAPVARVEAVFSNPALRWSGHGYLDHNRGAQPLEAAFRRWDWSRFSSSSATRILYDVSERGGAESSLALNISHNGEVISFEAPPRMALRSSLWRIARATRCDAGETACIIRTLEDTPFYARSVVETSLSGLRGAQIHESLDLDRFNSRLVQAMLPFRMPRNPF